jgi:ketosteroid isomerase-like protein
MSPTDAEALARRCFDTYRTADRTAIEALLHADFTFTSPQDDHIDRATYFERCWPQAGNFEFQDLHAVVPDGSGGCFVLYDGRARSGSTFRNMEQLRFKDGRILSTEVFFGREPGR